ncbi:MAG: DUF4124 domain-containing protein [Gammaproteobacteria bacterium]|nr:DUF4124 domain-containing protein [Gammaproteobacteria bacterium]
MSLRPKFLMLLLCLLPFAAAGEIYKWVDEDGTVHYGQSPPPDQQAETVKPPPSVDTEGAQKSLQEQREKLREMDEQRAERKKTAAEAEQEAAAMKERCEAAKRVLEQLRTQNRLQVTNEGGERTYMTPEQREEREKKAREMMEKNCQ